MNMNNYTFVKTSDGYYSKVIEETYSITHVCLYWLGSYKFDGQVFYQ